MSDSETQSEPLSRRLRNARREAGLTQTALAERVGCAQSAISMMEAGRMDALAHATLERIGTLLGVAVPAEGAAGGRVRTLSPALETGARYCPNPYCPANLPYEVAGDILFLSRAAGAGPCCKFCGEVLATECSACAAPARSSAACCVQCGRALVSAPVPPPYDPGGWVAERQRLCERLAAWVRPAAGG